MPVLQAALNTNPVASAGSLSIVDDSAIESFQGPSGTTKEVAEKVNADAISTYVVHPGDSLGSIAKMYGVTTQTILWANNLKSASDLHAGDELIILPISGVQYTVVKGDTLKGIAAKYHGDVADILAFNDLPDNYLPKVGDDIIIPDGETNVTPPSNGGGNKSGGSKNSKYGNLAGYFIRPTNGIKTQGLHGKYRTAVDIANSVGTPIYAAAGGTVIIARMGGYNGGYGNYIVIQHPNGVQTLYGHLSQILISPGSHVDQGDLIAKMGDTGNSTGPHLHFELWGGVRNWNPFN
jgi:murein DD-endopeptidase MepM/ murein hydrolase activator NlpD